MTTYMKDSNAPPLEAHRNECVNATMHECMNEERLAVKGNWKFLIAGIVHQASSIKYQVSSFQYPAGRALVVTAFKPPGNRVNSTFFARNGIAVTGKHPGLNTTNPGCLVAIFRRQAAVFLYRRSRETNRFVRPIRQRPQDLTTSEDVFINADRSVDAVGLKGLKRI